MDLAVVREKKSGPRPTTDAASDSPTREYVNIRNPNSPEADSPEREVNVKADIANLANVKADETYVGGWSTPSSELASMSDNEPEVSRVCFTGSVEAELPRSSLVAVPVPKPNKTAPEKIKTEDSKKKSQPKPEDGGKSSARTPWLQERSGGVRSYVS